MWYIVISLTITTYKRLFAEKNVYYTWLTDSIIFFNDFLDLRTRATSALTMMETKQEMDHPFIVVCYGDTV